MTWARVMGMGRMGAALLMFSLVFAVPVSPVSALAADYLVTTTADSGGGSLRQAISDANTAVGADTIIFASGVTGTITLASDLPEIAEDLTITGPGESSITIDGASSYRPFWVRSGISLTLSDMTLKRGKYAPERGSLIHNQQGTVSATNVTFRDDTGWAAVYNLSGGSIANYTECSFINNAVGIGGDHGDTPDTTTIESAYTNRTYVNDSFFRDNGYGIKQERYTSITGSTFRDNSYGAYIGGLNRSMIITTTFTNNGTALGFGNWTPTSWTGVGANNRFINGNTFTGNTTVFSLNDSWNDGHRSQRWTTITNNTWDGTGTWISASEWDGSTNASITKTDVNSTGVAWTESGNVIRLAVPPTTAAPVVEVPPPETTTTTSTSIAPAPSSVVSVQPLVAIEELPSTGSSTVTLLVGLVLIVLAGTVFAARKRLWG